MPVTYASKIESLSLLNLNRLGLLVVLSTPGLVILVYVLAYGVNVPVWDDWAFPGQMYSHWVAGELSVADVLAPSNEHQKIFPNLVFLAVGALSGWYLPIYMVFSWICIVLSFVLILSIFRNTNSKLFARELWLAVLWVVLLFSPVQYLNLLWAIQWVTFVPLLCLVLALWLQTLRISYQSKCVANAFLNTIAMFSFASGTLNWLFAFPTLTIHRDITSEPITHARGVTRSRLIFGAAGLLMFSVYFWNSELPFGADWKTQQTTQIGYTVVTRNEGTEMPVGTAVFSYRNGDGVLVTEAGVGAAELVERGRVFADEVGTRTGLALVNTSAATIPVTLTLRDGAGSQIGLQNLIMNPGQQRAIFVDTLFGAQPLDFRGNVTFESASGLGAITARESHNARGETLYTTLPVVDLDAAAGTDPVVFPHLAVGGGYRTQVVLVNRSAEAVTGRIQLLGSDGSPLQVDWDGVAASEGHYQIMSDGVYRVELTGAAAVQEGYAVVTPETGSTPAGSVIFQLWSGTTLVTEAGIGATPETTTARISIDNVGRHTRVAIANRGSTPAEVRFILQDRFATQQQQVTLTIPAGGHLARMAQELFPAVESGFSGLVEIQSSVPVATVTLQLTINALGEVVLTTLPVADLTRPLTATKVVFPVVAIGRGFATRFVFLNGGTASNVEMRFSKYDGSAMNVPIAGVTSNPFTFAFASGEGLRLFPGYPTTRSTLSLRVSASLQQLLLLAQFFVAWLGAPHCLWLGPDLGAATVIGGLIISVLLGSLFGVLRQWRRQGSGSLNRLYPWLCITAYAAMVGLMIAVGRVGLGMHVAMSPRYASYSLWLCVGLAGIVYSLASSSTKPISAPRKFLPIVFFASTLGWLSAGWVFGHGKFLDHHEQMKQNLLTLRLLPALPENPLAKLLLRNTTNLRQRSSRVMQAGLLDIQPIGPWLLASLSKPQRGRAGEFSLRREERHVVVNGWAKLPVTRMPADFVILARADNAGKVTAVTALTLTGEREDVARRHGTQQLLKSGFARKLDMTSDTDDTFLMFAVDMTAKRVYRLRQSSRR